ncbi:hypothetical protein [Oceanibacterium hippocampi]|uniref:Uncharacterized protein n=1 Tax=Oceanibacterium hippocampi TaxID=745714 RepID=A0A1Y5TYJ6_9PROT|nr:hypothetical protein [Oceanibacterium hippocampi]SLN76607.1 hypothetical protein OCH7691_04147 [Oceanibacterium hippocampi]
MTGISAGTRLFATRCLMLGLALGLVLGLVLGQAPGLSSAGNNPAPGQTAPRSDDGAVAAQWQTTAIMPSVQRLAATQADAPDADPSDPAPDREPDPRIAETVGPFRSSLRPCRPVDCPPARGPPSNAS